MTFVDCQATVNSSTETFPAVGYILPRDEKAEATKVLGFYVQGSLTFCSHSRNSVP